MANLTDVVQCFLFLDSSNEGDGISNLKLQKLVYYAQGFHIAIFDEPLFSEEISAWMHGPVVVDLYHEYKQYSSNPIPEVQDFDKGSLTKKEFEHVEEVFQVFGQFSAWKLRNMTHEEAPWLKYEAEAGIIPKHVIAEHFKARIN